MDLRAALRRPAGRLRLPGPAQGGTTRAAAGGTSRAVGAPGRPLAAPRARAEPLRPGLSLAVAAVAAVAAATIAVGLLWPNPFIELGAHLPPFTARWEPAVSVYALVGLGLLTAAVALAPRLRSPAIGSLGFAVAISALALVARLALNLLRAGPHDLYEVFVVRETFGEGRHEYLPGLLTLRDGAGHFLADFDRIVPSLPTHASGHPPGMLLLLDALGIDSAQGMAALTITVGVLAVPLLYLLAVRLFDDGRARVAALLFAFSPASLLYGATSADALYATLGMTAALGLMAGGRIVRLLGSAALAIASFFSWALLGVGAWAVVVTQQRAGWRRAATLAAIAGLGVLLFYVLLYVTTGFDPFAALRAAHDAYFEPGGIAERRPYVYWLLGSPVAFLVASGLPIAWRALRSLERGEATARALAVLVCASALLGYTKAETERIWLFMVPLACLAATASGAPRRLRGVLALLVGQAVAVELLLNTIW